MAAAIRMAFCRPDFCNSSTKFFVKARDRNKRQPNSTAPFATLRPVLPGRSSRPLTFSLPFPRYSKALERFSNSSDRLSFFSCFFQGGENAQQKGPPQIFLACHISRRRTRHGEFFWKLLFDHPHQGSFPGTPPAKYADRQWRIACLEISASVST